MEAVSFGEGRKALQFGKQKINLHLAGEELSPHARAPKPGSADLCFISNSSAVELLNILSTHEVKLELGPVKRTGAVGEIESVYFRDPDGNLIEVAHYI